MFVAEASQISIADVLAISQAAKSVVLIGDPQQLARPGDASHPPGAEPSGLEHILMDPELGKLKTMPEYLGLFTDETKRLPPQICECTSTAFYERRHHSRAFTRSRVIEGHSWLKGAGLWFVSVRHEGNRNSSTEEVDMIARIVEGPRKPNVKGLDRAGRGQPFMEEDSLIVA